MNEQKIKVGNRFVGDNEPLYLIAEIGINHNGSLDIAKKLIDATFVTGWDCAKFQKRTPDVAVPENQKNVLRETPWGTMTYLEYKKKIEFESAEYDSINDYCKEKAIDWTASVWDIQSLDFLMNYDIPFIKIPSAKITELELVKESCLTQKPIFASTGMSSWKQIDDLVDILEKYAGKNYILFHTISSYPADLTELNLQMICTLRDRYSCLVGYSGHEFEVMPTIMTPIYGACVVERHITLDHKMWGSDHSASLEIEGMKYLEKRIRQVRKIAGNGVKLLSEKELIAQKKLRGE